MSPLGQAERIDRLRLARTDGVGPVAFRELLERFGSAAAALDALPGMARRGGRSDLRIPSKVDAEREMAAGQALGAQLIFAGEPSFSNQLAALDPPPPLLWVRGDPALLAKPAVAIVGARIASAAGQRFARQLAVDLGAAGLVVASGMARGVDGAAHEGALETGTVAVLGGGVDDVYPPEHADLYQRLITQGCVVSESEPGRRAQARDFPRRNRIIAGLSLGVVVVEAEMKSGSLITARLAGEQGREVFAVPGSPLDPRARGTNDLIRQGATLCESAGDVLDVIRNLPLAREPERNPWRQGPPMDDAMIEKLARRLDDLLSPAPVTRDELARMVDAPSGLVAAALVELAIAGRAELLSGGMVRRA